MKKFLAFLLVILVLSGAGCANGHGGERLTPEEAHNLMEENEDVLLVDVRSPSEYEEKRIPGAVLIPLSSLEESIAIYAKETSTPIILYCQSGRRSATAVEVLIDLGYGEVYDLGGIADWPYETKAGP